MLVRRQGDTVHNHTLKGLGGTIHNDPLKGGTIRNHTLRIEIEAAREGITVMTAEHILWTPREGAREGITVMTAEHILWTPREGAREGITVMTAVITIAHCSREGLTGAACLSLHPPPPCLRLHRRTN